MDTPFSKSLAGGIVGGERKLGHSRGRYGGQGRYGIERYFFLFFVFSNDGSRWKIFIGRRRDSRKRGGSLEI